MKKMTIIILVLALITACSKVEYIEPTYPTLNTFYVDEYVSPEILVEYEITEQNGTETENGTETDND